MTEKVRRSGSLKVTAVFLAAMVGGGAMGAVAGGIERWQQAKEKYVPLSFDSASVLGGCSITGARLYGDGHVQLTLRTPSDIPNRMRRTVEGGAYPDRAIFLSANDKGVQKPTKPLFVPAETAIFSSYGATYNFDETYPGFHNVQVDMTAAGVDPAQINPSKDLVYCGSVQAA